jgi:hypothetical protein
MNKAKVLRDKMKKYVGKGGPTSTASKTATKTATSTKTSTVANPHGNVTVTGGAGDGATTVHIAMPAHPESKVKK